MNTNAQKLFNTAKLNMQKAQDAPTKILNSVERFMKYIMAGRIGLSIFLVGWTVMISYFLMRPRDTEEDRRRYYDLHRSWFGDESVFMIIFKMWYYTLILFAAGPILRELVMFFKLRLML